MTAFDSDVMSDIIRGDPDTLALLDAVPLTEQCIPIVVCEEAIRGWLNLIKLASAGRTKTSLETAYHRFDDALAVLLSLRRLRYSVAADQLFTKWRAAKIRVGTQDLRIAAICVAHDATLVSRNRRDFDTVPELKLSVWN